MVLKRTVHEWLPYRRAVRAWLESLTSKSIEGTSLALEGIHYIHGSDSLPLGMLSVCDRISDHILQEDFEHSPGLFVDESRDTLDTSSASKTADGWLGDTLDVVSQHLPVTLGAPLSESLSSFSSSRHG